MDTNQMERYTMTSQLMMSMAQSLKDLMWLDVVWLFRETRFSLLTMADS